MSHRFYEGEIFHKRFFPRQHVFTYDYFFLDAEVENLASLENSLFKLNRFGVMSFFAHDHFGSSRDFLSNAKELIEALGWSDYASIRFLTLPRMFHFVFNPLSMLLLLDEDGSPTHCVAEVHNYNGGRVLYPMTLERDTYAHLYATSPKSMYVSPFMGYEGTYTFHIEYSPEHFGLRIDLSEGNQHMLIAHFSGASRPYGTKSIRSLLCNHTFLSLFVVTRTLWQSLRLKLKGLSWNSPRLIDQTHKELV